MSKTFLLRLYGLAMAAAAPFLPLYLNQRAKQGKEDPARLKERFGHGSLPRPDGPLIWIHGASVGETSMAVPIIKRLLTDNPKLHILITSGTVTSAALLKARLPARAIHQYVPIDSPQAAARFLAHWKPNLGLWLESEIWPHLILQSRAQNIPLVLLNARLSESSRKGWQKRPKSARVLFGAFDDILPADHPTSQWLAKIIGRPCPIFGNLKMTAPPLTVDEALLYSLKTQIKDRPIWCAASTHKGEDEIILNAHGTVLKSHPNALLIHVPRHPQRSADIETMITQKGLSHVKLSTPITNTTQIILINEIGKMGLAYRLASTVMMGGSLLPHLNGHNPYEAAQLDCAVLSGPHVSSFDGLYSDMETSGAVEIIKPNDTALADIICRLWQTADGDISLRTAANVFTAKQMNKMDALLTRLKPFTSPLNRL